MSRLIQKALCRSSFSSRQKVGSVLPLLCRPSSTSSDGSNDGEKKRIPRAGKYRPPWKVLKEEFQGIKTMKPAGTEIPRETDILIIGGGAIGSSIAYWIKQRNPKGSNVVVVERDPGYTRASSMLSAGGIRHQFTVPENVQLSLFSSEFLCNIKEHLSVIHEDPPDVQFNHQGYLFLATPRSAESMVEIVKMQRECGANIELLSKAQLAKRFPWMNLEGIECASLGLEGEGWIDPWLLVRALKQKNISLDVKYVCGELVDFEFCTREDGSPPELDLRLDSGVIRDYDGVEHEMRFAIVINCAGPWAADVAEMAKIGIGPGDLSYPLPVEPRKRFIYLNHCPTAPGCDCPFVVDPTGVYLRREGLGGNYICGSSPESEEEEPDIGNFDVDYEFYENKVWPQIAYRMPCFENSKLRSAWAGYYEYNTFDQNLVIGQHPFHRNFYFANGLSGHGLQHSIAIGRAMMELIMDGEYKTINLQRFHFDRFIRQEPVLEKNIV